MFRYISFARQCFLSIVFFIWLLPVSAQIDSSFAEKVFKNFYYIKRLSKTVKFLCGTQSISYTSHEELESMKKSLHEKELVQVVDELSSAHSTKLLQKTWHNFCLYKYVNREWYLYEFTKILLLLYKMYFLSISRSCSTKKSKVILKIIDKGLAAPLTCDRICFIDKLYIYATKQKKQKINSKIPSNVSFVDVVSHRYYLIERLKEPFAILQKYTKLHGCISAHDFFQNESAIINSKLTHNAILECIDIIKEKKSFKPVLLLWMDVCSYRFVAHDQFSQEFSLLVFAILRHLITCAQQHQDLVTINKMNKMSLMYATHEYIESLPLEELLVAIDSLSSDLLIMAEKYELNNAKMSWGHWLKKYWWVPPLIGVTIALKFSLIVKMVQGNH